MSTPSRSELRKTLRARRRSLPPYRQKQAALALAKKLRSHPVFLKSRHIALYMAEDGEIDPIYLMREAEKMGKCCYLPVLNPNKQHNLHFKRHKTGDPLLLNYFNILEPPAEKKTFPAWALDLVLMPLVGFDRQGNRLGMGGGFYDRTFAFLKKQTTKNTKQKNETGKKKSKSVVLVGLAHNCQEEAFLACEVWDIPLDYIITDKEVIEVTH